MPQTIDGRTARAERTRTAIVDALLALLAEGELKPTGEKIADRAGVSLRALWTNFRDMETLYSASGNKVLAQVDAVFQAVPSHLPLAERVERFCQQRTSILQLIAPAARASHMREPLSPQLHRNRLQHVARVRGEIAVLFAAELTEAGGQARELTNALIAATMWPAWSMLLDGLELSADDGLGVMVRTVGALLAPFSSGS